MRQIYPSQNQIQQTSFSLQTLQHNNTLADRQQLLEDQDFNSSEQINKQLTISYLQKLNNIIIKKIGNLNQLEINYLNTQKQNVLNYFNSEVIPYFQQILSQFIQYQKQNQTKANNIFVKDLIDMCMKVYEKKFSNQQIFHLKEILLLYCLLIEDDAQAIIQNQNQAALRILKQKFSISDFQDNYFDQIPLLYFEKMTQNYYEVDCISLEYLTNSNSSWTLENQLHIDKNNLNNYTNEDQYIADLIELNKKIRAQCLEKYKYMQHQFLKHIKNISLIHTRFKAILIIAKTEKTESSIQEELMNVQYKSKKRFLKGLEKIAKFQLDFTKRDSKIAELLNNIIPELEFQSNIYIQQLRANIFVDRVDINQDIQTVTLQSKEYREIKKTDDKGREYIVQEEYYQNHDFKYIKNATASVSNSNIKIHQEMNLKNIEQNIEQFISHLKELIDQHNNNQLQIQKEIQNLKNDPQFIESRNKSRERKKIFIGQDLEEIQQNYLNNLKNIESKDSDLSSRLDCLSYYFFPNQIYVLDSKDLINFLKQQNSFDYEYEKLFASTVREKLQLQNSCWVNSNERNKKFMFLNYVDIADQFKSTNKQISDLILDHAVQSRADIAFNFKKFSENDQIKQNKLFLIVKKNFVAQRYQLVSNYQQLDKIINQVMDQFKQYKKNNLISCQVAKGCSDKTKYYISKIHLDFMQKKFRKILFDQNEQNDQMTKFIFDIDMKPGSNLEFYLKYLSLRFLKKKKKRCCC